MKGLSWKYAFLFVLNCKYTI